MDENEISHEIVGAALDVHRALGPGLLESVYEIALEHELVSRGLHVKRQIQLPVIYKGIPLEAGFRVDMMVNESVIVETKAVERLLPIHGAQLLTYLRLANKRLGLLLNFNSITLRAGIKRVVNNL